MLPAARVADFHAFAESVYRYGYAAGECFAANQGGPFLTPEIGEFVAFCRSSGVTGVGQSSWGPTVYCWFDEQSSADAFVSELDKTNFEVDTLVTAVSNRGAVKFENE